jgi:cytochrome c oxidase subunit 2
MLAPIRENPGQLLGPQFPRDVSAHGYRIDDLLVISIAALTLLFVIMCIWMGWACLKHGPKHKAQYTKGDSRKSIMMTMALALGVFLVVDGNLWFNSTYDMHDLFWNFDKVDQDPDVVRIELNAHQWAWDTRYAGPDGKFNTRDDIVSLNDIRVPVGRPVLFQISSSDVVHSLYLPNLRVKQDAVPGMITRAWFEAKETGEFDVACAQHCGTHHYLMKARLTIMEQDEFDRWSKSMSQMHAQAFDDKDTDAQWGWDWKGKG